MPTDAYIKEMPMTEPRTSPVPDPDEEIDLGDVAQILANAPSLWISLYENGNGFHVITPSITHAGYAYVDDFDVAGGFVDVARRPIRYDALPLFLPGTKWRRLDKVGGVIKLLRDCVPERAADIARLAA